MYLKNINIYAKGNFTGRTHEENLLITQESYNKLQDEINNIRCYIEELDGEYSEVKADVNVTEDKINKLSDGDILWWKLHDIFKDNGLDFIEEQNKINSYLGLN